MSCTVLCKVMLVWGSLVGKSRFSMCASFLGTLFTLRFFDGAGSLELCPGSACCIDV